MTMATTTVHSFVCFVVFFSMVVVSSSSGQRHPHFCKNTPNSSGQLTPDYYRFSCPNVFITVKRIVEQAIKCEPRMGASLLRLHFHDCWVSGCDGSVLLIDIGNFIGEQSAIPNKNSLRGFDVVAQIKAELNSVCPCGNVVSCADILAIAARDSIHILGGPRYQVLLGRLDSLTANVADAKNLPSPSSNFTKLIANFLSHGFGLKDLVVLSGAHTIGRARCGTFRSRIFNDNDINSNFADGLKTVCPANASLGGNNTAPFDATTNVFDTVYYQELTRQMGLLHSDQELYSGGNQTSADLVMKYSKNRAAFWGDFVVSIIKMGNLPPASSNGQVRCNCSIVNNPSPPPNSHGITTSCPSPPASFFNPGTGPTHCPSLPTSSPNLGSP